MASANKTGYLNLNQWQGTDKPKMTDFNADNQKIDSGISALSTSLSAHAASALLHLTTADKEKIASVVGVEVLAYNGDGTNQRKILLGYKPSFGIIFAVDRPMFERGADSSLNQNSVVFTQLGCAEGVLLENDGLRLTHSGFNRPDGNGIRINSVGVEYVIIAAR